MDQIRSLSVRWKVKSLQALSPARGLFWVLATWGSLFLYIWPRMFVAAPDGIYAGDRCIWGDWAGHLSGIAVFAFRPVSMWFQDHPLFYGLPFNYPFASSMISGMMMRMGADRVSALVIPSIITTLALLAILYCFYRVILKSEKQAFVAVSLFLLSSGFGFVYYFQDILQTPTINTVLFPIREYSFLEDKGLFFRNIIAGELLPQRSFLLGLPAGLLLLMILMSWFTTGDKQPSALRCLLTGIPAGLMMVVHTHTYMVLVIICLCLAIINFRSYKTMLTFALGAGLVSLWIYAQLHGQSLPGKWFGFLCGWKSDIRQKGLLQFAILWLMNWGMLLPLAAWGTFRMKYYRHPMVVSGWVLFILSNVIRFQPWDWDNTKILTWSYLLLIIPVMSVLSVLWKDKGRIGKVTTVVFLILLTFSGGLELIKLIESNPKSYKMWDQSKLLMASELQRMLNPEETVLTDDDHLNWVSCLAGGQILMGYRGWLWAWGIDYSSRENDIRIMYSAGPGAEALFKKYHVRYAVFTPSAKRNFEANEVYFLMKYKMVLNDNDTRVYDIQSRREKS